MQAEARGAYAACLAAMAWGGHVRRVCITGDNPAVLRHAAACGRLHDPEAGQAVERGLTSLAARGWQATWRLCPRSGNDPAHVAAAEATVWARRMRQEGQTDEAIGVTMHEEGDTRGGRARIEAWERPADLGHLSILLRRAGWVEGPAEG